MDLAGLPVDRDRLYDIAERRKLRVIEDAAQSMGASWNGRKIGSFGDLVSFSFHANKNMTTTEGGCLVVNNEAEGDLATRLRLQGVVRSADGEQEVEVAGGKNNMTDVAARIGLGQLKHIDAFNARRRELARHYFKCFDKALGCGMPVADFTNSNWHMFQVTLPAGANRGASSRPCRTRASASVCITRPCTCSSCTVPWATARACFPHAEAVGCQPGDAAALSSHDGSRRGTRMHAR